MEENEKGLQFSSNFCSDGIHPFEKVEWEHRDAIIKGANGKVFFQQKSVETPKSWSQSALNVVVSKYFRGLIETADREKSVKQLIDRVTRTITDWGIKDGYFATKEDSTNFYMDLTHLMLFQYASFNSPVWFNVGVEKDPQCSACFILSVDDTMESILELVKIEGMLFKYGSGSGVNLSTLRSSREKLSSGGIASGPVSFMRGYDAFAGVIKSGGKTRRAAKMQILNIEHPDVIEFIESPSNEEKKAWALIEQGYDGSFDGEAYNSVFFQNANLSVRASDEFMQSVDDDSPFRTRKVKVPKGYPKGTVDVYKARDIMHKIAEGTYVCGDPGIQFDDIINKWNPCLNQFRINASNPCSEYMFIDNSACNLASLNLLKFKGKGRTFDVEMFKHAVRILITAQDIIVDNAKYPLDKVKVHSREYRPLGLGYANLGALLMSFGLPYDSVEGRTYASAITSIMTGEAYRWSSIIAEKLGTFKHYEANKSSFIRVMKQHYEAAEKINKNILPLNLAKQSTKLWETVIERSSKFGFRNAQTTVLAPTGTIGFMMDCATTGIEPDIALVKYKKLVGGGVLKIVNSTVPEALKNLEYTEEEIKHINDYIDNNDTIEGAPGLKSEHLNVFDCAFKPLHGTRLIHYIGHLEMLAAVQPFISGGISKTVNLPNNITVEEIEKAYMVAWKKGLKSVAMYRDGSKGIQPLSLEKDDKDKKEKKKDDTPGKPYRRRLPDERYSLTHKFTVGGHEGYLIVGMYPDGMPGEVFISMSKLGSFIAGLMDQFATATSIMLQYGVPLDVLVNKFAYAKFDPQGITNNPQIKFAKSIIDYIFRYLAIKFLNKKEYANQALTKDTNTINYESVKKLAATTGDITRDIPFEGIHRVETAKIDASKNSDGNEESAEKFEDAKKYAKSLYGDPVTKFYNDDAGTKKRDEFLASAQSDAIACPVCSSIMFRSGSCYTCPECGNTSGCS